MVFSGQIVMRIKNVSDIDAWRMCVGCGACAYICPEGNISLVNVTQDGIRPRVAEGRCKECGECLKVCPGISIAHTYDPQAAELIPGMSTRWGPILEVWEGHASDADIRYKGSSGGLASALALYCIEKGGMHGVLHVGPHKYKPLENTTVVSTNRAQILERTGSRYSPASPCDGLEMIESAPAPCVFIGKPCDVTAVRKAQSIKPALDGKIGITIGIFCAGTPSTQGTLDLLHSLGIDPNRVEALRYRGKGWPGKFSVKLKGDERPREILTYMDAWGFVQKYRPYRCHLCPDATSEFADIACGDPWYRRIEAGEQGHSLVLVRTELGRKMLSGAIEFGAVKLKRVNPSVLEASQRDMPLKRGAVWGRILAMKSFGIPSPTLNGFFLFKNWQRLTLKDKARSILGTARRIVQRGYYKPLTKGLR
jgi:coenzyme F420 hydrogenase subunit beta